MYFIYAFVLIMSIYTAMTTQYRQAVSDAPAAVAAASAQVNQYRMFMYVASEYMKSYGGGAGTIYWAQLSTAPTTPSGAKGRAMPGTWRVVVAGDSTWVACTQMDEAAIGIIQQLATAGGATLNKTVIASSNYVYVGAPADIGRTNQCS